MRFCALTLPLIVAHLVINTQILKYSRFTTEILELKPHFQACTSVQMCFSDRPASAHRFNNYSSKCPDILATLTLATRFQAVCYYPP